MKNPLRYSKLFVNAILLLTTPALVAYPQADVLAIHPSSSFADKGDIMQQLLTEDGLLSYDAVLRLLSEIENGDLEEAALSPEDLDKIKNFLAFLAQQGVMPDDTQEQKDAIERDIQELLSLDEEDVAFANSAYFPYQMGEYTIVPAVFYGQRDVMLCKSWLSKRWKHCKKFVKNHKKEVIIGTVLVVAAVAIIVTAGAAAPAAAGAAAAATAGAKESSHQERKETSSESILQPTVEGQVSSLKETISQNNLLPLFSEKENQKENARIVGSTVAHETLGSISNFSSMPYLYGNAGNYEQIITAGHGKIDEAFSTETADRYINRETVNASSTSLQGKVYQFQGEQALKYECYDQAIAHFGKAIDEQACDQEAYLQRAFAYFKQGEYGKALDDYQTFFKKLNPPSQVVDNAIVSMGLLRGSLESGRQTILFTSDFIKHPIDGINAVGESFSSLAKLAYSREFKMLGQIVVPDVYNLVNEWSSLTQQERLEHCAYIVGKYGSDILLPGTIIKGCSRLGRKFREIPRLSKNLQRVERNLVLEGAFSQSVEDFNKFTEAAVKSTEKASAPAKEMTAFHNEGTLVEQNAAKFGLPKEEVKILNQGLTIVQEKILFKSAENTFDKNLTHLAHSFSKHAGRHPETWGALKGSMNTWHEQALEQLKNICNSPGGFVQVVDPKTGLTWIEKRLPDGRGIRLNQDYTFKGFVD